MATGTETAFEAKTEKRTYVAPQIASSGTFERYALACTGQEGFNPPVDCPAAQKSGGAANCSACVNGS